MWTCGKSGKSTSKRLRVFDHSLTLCLSCSKTPCKKPLHMTLVAVNTLTQLTDRLQSTSFSQSAARSSYTLSSTNLPSRISRLQTPSSSRKHKISLFSPESLRNLTKIFPPFDSPMCAYFGSDDMSKKNDDPRHFAYGHSGDNGVYLNYGTFDNGKACDAAGGANKPFSQGDCQYALSKMFPACDGQAGGSIPYKCVLYEYKFRKWDSVQDANVKF